MKKLLLVVLVGMFVVTLTAVSHAATALDQAKAMVEDAIAFYKANGKEKVIAEANSPKGRFVKGGIYVAIHALDGTMLAHPFNPKVIGMNLLNVPDPDGKFFRREVMETAKTQPEGGWVDYKYKNPKTNRTEQKTSFVKKSGDLVFVCGIYK
jgi:signal transduction histidine kinase